ncbi:hypothetical protein ABLN72_06775 [Mycobacterium tuberculosis]
MFNLQASQHFHCFRIYRETLSRSCANFNPNTSCFAFYRETLSRFRAPLHCASLQRAV